MNVMPSLMRDRGEQSVSRRLARAILIGGLSLATSWASAQGVDNHLRIIVPGGPGGGWDITARAMQPTLASQGGVASTSVENIPGTGGTIGLARFVSAEHGRNDVLMLSGLTMMMASVSYRSPLTFSDVTPIARLTGDREVLVVAADSPFRVLRDLIEAFRAAPESISWAGGAAGGTEELLAWLIAEAAGIAPERVNYIAFAGSGEANPAVVSGQVTAGLGPLVSMVPYLQAGTLRMLAVSSPERIPSLDVPTFREQGIDIDFANWRSVVAPPGVSAADRKRLEDMVAAMVQSPAWREILGRYRWEDNFLTGPAFVEFLQTEDRRVRGLFRRLRRDSDEGAGSFGSYPLFVLAGLLASSIAAVVVVRRSGARLVRPAARGRTALALLVFGTFVNVLVMEPVGLASTVLFWLVAHAFDASRPWRHLAFGFGVSATAYVVFVRLLDVTLPPGMLVSFLSRAG